MTFSIHGLAVARGIAIGRAVLVASSRVDVAHYFIKPDQVDGEIDRLKRAKEVVYQEVQRLQLALPKDAPTELAALLDVHLMLLQDELLAEGVAHWISERLYNAEWALTSQLDVVARQFDEMEDLYLRERKADLEQVVERVLRQLKGAPTGVPQPAVRRPGSQHGKPQRNGGHDELAAPHRRFAGQQGTGAVTYAAAHGFTGAGAAAESRKATYWVIAGVAGCICNFSLASLSTRMGVACARFSASALSLSISSLRICKAAFSSSTNSRRDSYWVCTRYSALNTTATIVNGTRIFYNGRRRAPATSSSSDLL